jgi:predicted amidohydrolase
VAERCFPAKDRRLKMRISVFQSPSGSLGVAERLERLGLAMAGAAADGAELLICPELYMSGYNVGKALSERAEPADGPFAAGVAELARRRGVAVIYGFPEIDNRRLYNSVACISAVGEPLAVHRKRLLPPGPESDYFDVGAGDTLCKVGDFSVAIVICYEAEFPEAVRSATLAGAQLVAAPTALSEVWPDIANRMMPTRALENGVYLAYANHSGEEDGLRYLGGSCIIDPNGKELARAGAGEELITAELSQEVVEDARARLPYLRDRDTFIA